MGTSTKIKDGQSVMNSQLNPVALSSNNYSINDDNEGLSKWLAYNLGLQMVWTEITRSFRHKAENQGETLDDLINPLVD